MKYRYKDQTIDTVIFDAFQNEDGSWSVQFPTQSNELVYSDGDFKNNFEECDGLLIEKVELSLFGRIKQKLGLY